MTEKGKKPDDEKLFNPEYLKQAGKHALDGYSQIELLRMVRALEDVTKMWDLMNHDNSIIKHAASRRVLELVDKAKKEALPVENYVIDGGDETEYLFCMGSGGTGGAELHADDADEMTNDEADDLEDILDGMDPAEGDNFREALTEAKTPQDVRAIIRRRALNVLAETEGRK